MTKNIEKITDELNDNQIMFELIRENLLQEEIKSIIDKEITIEEKKKLIEERTNSILNF